MNKVYITYKRKYETTILGVFTSFELAQKSFPNESHGKFEFYHWEEDENIWGHYSGDFTYEIKEVDLDKASITWNPS